MPVCVGASPLDTSMLALQLGSSQHLSMDQPKDTPVPAISIPLGKPHIGDLPVGGLCINSWKVSDSHINNISSNSYL